jgi:hypothetical protein
MKSQVEHVDQNHFSPPSPSFKKENKTQKSVEKSENVTYNINPGFEI